MNYLDVGFNDYLLRPLEASYTEQVGLVSSSSYDQISGLQVKGDKIISLNNNLTFNLENNSFTVNENAETNKIEIGKLSDGNIGMIIRDSQGNVILKNSGNTNLIQSSDGNLQFDLGKSTFSLKDLTGKELLTLNPSTQTLQSPDGDFVISLDQGFISFKIRGNEFFRMDKKKMYMTMKAISANSGGPELRFTDYSEVYGLFIQFSELNPYVTDISPISATDNLIFGYTRDWLSLTINATTIYLNGQIVKDFGGTDYYLRRNGADNTAYWSTTAGD